jgi:hypothetical protein
MPRNSILAAVWKSRDVRWDVKKDIMNDKDGGDRCTDTEGGLGLRKAATVIDDDEGGNSLANQGLRLAGLTRREPGGVPGGAARTTPTMKQSGIGYGMRDGTGKGGCGNDDDYCGDEELVGHKTCPTDYLRCALRRPHKPQTRVAWPNPDRGGRF